MEKRGNKKLAALGWVAGVGVLLLAFLVVWLLPHGPENSDAQVQNPSAGGSVSSGASSSISGAGAQTSGKAAYSQAGGPTMAAVSDQAHISVHGTGSISAKPDMATIQVGVQIQNSSLSAAQSEAATKMDAVMKQLKDAGIDEKDISTSQYNVEPVMNYRDNQPPEVTGYRVTNIVNVKIHDLTKAGQLIDSLVSSGANSLYGISFGFSDPTALMKQAREAAMKNAQDTAAQLATLGGVTLGGPIVIEDGGSNVPIPPVAMAAGAADVSGKMASTAINPGQQEVRADVNVTYAIK